MRIVHIPRRFVVDRWGGTETVVLELAKAQRRRGDEASIVTTMALAHSQEETVDGVRVRRFRHFYPYWGLSPTDRDQMDNKGGNLVSFELYRELLRMETPSIFHLHTGKRLGALVRSAARRVDIPYLVHLHGGLLGAPASERADLIAPAKGSFEWGKLIGLLYGGRRVVQDADAILCVDGGEAEQLATAMPWKRVRFIPNGVDTARFAADREDGLAFRKKAGIPVDRPLILSVGRVDPQKNQLLAIEILQRVRAQRPGTCLALAGPTTNEAYRREVEAQVRDRNLESSVFFLGQLDYVVKEGGPSELAAAYAAADAFLLASVHEPFGVVALEAWAAGVPLVASAVGGIPAFVHHGQDGLLFPSKEAEAAADDLCHILSDRSVAEELIRRGRMEVERHYTWDAVNAAVYGVYEEVLASRRRRP